MSFGEKLKAIRKKQNITQEQFAELLNVSRQAVSKWESDNGYPETEKLLIISKEFNMWNKAEHLENIRKSKYFSFTREAVFSAKEKCNGDRFIKIALSQGSVQNIIKYNEDLIADALKEFQDIIENEFVNTTKTIIYNYRMRIGIK